MIDPLNISCKKKYKRSSQLWTLLKEKIKAARISYIRFFTAVHTYDFHISTIIISCEVSALKWYGILFLPSLPIKRMSVDCRFTANFSQVTLTSHWYPIKLRGGVRHGASKLSKIKKNTVTWTRLKPRPLRPRSSALITKPLNLLNQAHPCTVSHKRIQAYTIQRQTLILTNKYSNQISPQFL